MANGKRQIRVFFFFFYNFTCKYKIYTTLYPGKLINILYKT